MEISSIRIDFPRSCQQCGAELVPVVTGLPSPELSDAAERGEIALGGCLWGDDSPAMVCPRCSPEDCLGSSGKRADSCSGICQPG